ncbi:hypothetical protein ACFTAO_43455 [Paenibacillus rhizoplanae]
MEKETAIGKLIANFIHLKSAKLTDKYGFNSSLNANKAVITGNTTALKAEATAEATGTEMKVSIERLATRATVETRGVGAGKSSQTTLAELFLTRQ